MIPPPADLPLSEIISLDFETDYSDDYSLTNMGTWAYVFDERFRAYMVSIYNEELGISYAGPVEEFDWHSIDGKYLLIHNGHFDGLCIIRLQQDKIIPPEIEFPGIYDTVDMARYLRSKGTLAEVSKNFLGTELDKSVRDRMKGKTLEDARREGFEKELLDYAMWDAIMPYRFWVQERHRWPQLEAQVSQLNREAGWRGFHINGKRLTDGLNTFKERRFDAQKNIPWKKQEKHKTPVGSAYRVAQCRKDGIKIPACFDKSDFEFQEWYRENAPNHPWIEAVADWQQANSFLKNLKTIEDRLRPDDTFPFALKYHGAHCVPGDTEVLTPSGWERLDSWAGGDIAQWHMDTNKLEFLAASPNRFEVNDEDSHVRIDSAYVSGSFTLGHTVPYYKHGSKEPATLKAADLIGRGSIYIPTAGILTTKGEIDSVEMRLLVAIQADGHWCTDKRQGRELRFTLRKARKRDRLKMLLDELGIAWREHEYESSKGQYNVRIRWADVPNWLKPEMKTFGPWLLNSTLAARFAFCDELKYWDGYETPTRATEYCSINRTNAEWVQTIAHLTGAHTSGKIFERKAKGNKKTCFRIVVSPVKSLGKRPSTIVSSRDILQIQGPIKEAYCPTTQTGFWLCRSNGTIFITGNTGRFSGGGGFNMQNLPRAAIMGVNLRNLFVAPPGKKLFVIDFESIEGIIFAWLTKRQDILDEINAGGNVYEIHAKHVMGLKWDGSLKLWDKEHGTNHYTKSKVETLALGYGGAHNALKKYCAIYGLDMTQEERQQSIDRARTMRYDWVNFWGQMQAMLDHAGNRKQDCVIETPAGYELRYHQCRRINGGVQAVVNLGEKYRKVYGGSVTENVMQSTAGSILKEAWVRLAENNHTVITNVHDELIGILDEDKADEQFKEVLQIIIERPEWAKTLPVRAEGEIVDMYQKI